jgi:hypothetical protein
VLAKEVSEFQAVIRPTKKIFLFRMFLLRKGLASIDITFPCFLPFVFGTDNRKNNRNRSLVTLPSRH